MNIDINIVEILGIVAATTVIVAIMGIGNKGAKRIFEQREVNNDLEKEKQLPVLKMTERCRSMLSAATISNVIGLVVLIWERSLSLVTVIAGIIAFFVALKAVKIIYKNHMPEGKLLAIANLVLASFLIFFNAIGFGLVLWAITHLDIPFL